MLVHEPDDPEGHDGASEREEERRKTEVVNKVRIPAIMNAGALRGGRRVK